MIEDTEKSEFVSNISQTKSQLVASIDSLLMDIDNNVCKQFNSVINKHLAGKRINYSQKNHTIPELKLQLYRITHIANSYVSWTKKNSIILVQVNIF